MAAYPVLHNHNIRYVIYEIVKNDQLSSLLSNTADTGLGYSAELAELMARELGSPKAIDRMTSYIRQAHPRTEEMLVDEMLAIKGEIDAWREKKESQEAQARYNARLYYKKW